MDKPISLRKLEARIEIKSSPASVISAFTDPAMLQAWWKVERSLIDLRPGGCYTLAWNISPQGFGYISTGIIREYDPHSLLVIDNFIYLNPERSLLGPMELSIRAREKGGATECYVCQDGYRHGGDWDWYYEAVKEAWPLVLGELKKFMEGSR